jgi:hypothetical protein
VIKSLALQAWRPVGLIRTENPGIKSEKPLKAEVNVGYRTVVVPNGRFGFILGVARPFVLKGGGDRTIKGGVQIALASLIVGQNRQIAAALFAIAVCL